MPVKNKESRKNPGGSFKIRWSLSFFVVIGLVLLISIPVSVMGLATYLRSRSLMQEQATSQFKSIVNTSASEVNQVEKSSQSYLKDLITDVATHSILMDLVKDPTSESSRFLARVQLNTYLRQTPLLGTRGADQISVILPNGTIVVSTKEDLAGKQVDGLTEIKELIGKNATTTVYGLGDWYPEEYTLISTRTLTPGNSNNFLATILITAPTARFEQVLASTGAVLSQSSAYFVTQNSDLVGIDAATGNFTRLTMPYKQRMSLVDILKSPSGEGSFQFDTAVDGRVMGYAKWVPSINTGIYLTVPEKVVFQQANTLIPFSVLLVLLSVLAAAALAFLGARYITRPLVQLSNAARKFAEGDWTGRVRLNRSDEIGLLANSFNNMVDQLSDLYRSMENKVEERSRHIRSASEIGQIATSANSREEIAQKTVKLVIERFGFPFAAIAILDSSGSNAVVTAVESTDQSVKGMMGRLLPVGGVSLIGWVAQNNQVRVIKDTAEENEFTTTLLQTGSRSEIAIPISVGNQVLGVLEVQSAGSQGYDQETISVLQTVSNQVANGLQNMRLLEATQINLEETTLLYQASRRITTTQSEEEILKIFSETLMKTPYMVGIFAVQTNFISVISIIDPENPQATASAQGITLPLKNLSASLAQSNYVILDDLTTRSDFDHLLSFFTRRGCHTAAIFPVVVNGSLSRVFILGSRESIALTETSLQPFAYLFEVITTTLDRFHILETLQHRVSELQTISSVSQAISAETDVYQLYHLLHQQVMQIIGSDISFLVANYSAKEQMISIPYIYENGELLSVNPFPLGEGLTSYLINTRQPLMMVKDTEAQTQKLGAKIIGMPAKSWLGVPLILAGEVIGAIILQDTNKEERFNETDLALFTTLAPQIATAIRNAQLVTEMQQALRAYDQERFLLNTLLENIPEQVFFKDGQGRYLRVSQSFAHQIGLNSPVEVINHTESELDHTIDPDESRETFERILTSGQAEKTLEKIGEGDAATWQEKSQIPMLNQEQLPVGILGIAHDVTDLKRSEEVANHRAEYLRISQEIARDTSLTLEIEALLRNAVEMVRERFNFYHASIFLIDEKGEMAELKESTGEVGQQMKARQHRLAIGSKSLVGKATGEGIPVVINDVTAEPDYFANPLLPETRSELVIPMKFAEKVIGAIDVQSTVFNAFSKESVTILQMLADQMAIAINNASLFSNTQKNLEQHRMIHRVTVTASTAQDVDAALLNTATALHEKRPDDRIAIYLLRPSGHLEIHSTAGFEERNPSNTLIDLGQGLVGKAAQTRQQMVVKDFFDTKSGETVSLRTRSAIASPIVFNNQLIGILYAENPLPNAYQEFDEEVFLSLANTLGAIITNARLVGMVRQQVERQRQLYEVTNRIRQTVDIRTIMQVSANEIARTLDAHRARINLNPEEVAKTKASIGGNGHEVEEEKK